MKIKLYITACLFVISNALAAQIPSLERIEPAFWWVGMKNPHLQLLVHGKDIATRTVNLSYPGVKVLQVHKVENPNYLFIDLDVTPLAKPGSFAISFVKAGDKKISYTYQLLQRDHAVRAQGVTSKDLIYLLMPDRFSNGDPSNDSNPSMREVGINRDSIYYRHGGDIQGVINHLDYLKDLGVTAIWMTPEIENDEPHASYHGYAVTDHYKTDPRYGTNELYKAYVAKCHAMGLKVIKDLVHNHCGIEHWFIQDMPMKSWVHQWPQYTQSNFRYGAVTDPHAAPSDTKQMLDGWFDHSMADMNESNPYVQNYLTQNHIWWVEYAGVDGFRLDTYPYNDAAYMADWAKKVKAEYPNLSIFGEVLDTEVSFEAYFTQGNTINRGFDTHLPGITDAALKDAIAEALNGKEGWNDGVNRLYNVLAQDYMYQDPTRNTVFLDNHDMSRFYSVIKEDISKYRSGMAMLLTMRGVPQMYYGDEILMKNESKPDGLVRLDFPGGWPGDKLNKFTEQGRTEQENDAFNYVRTLANYRKGCSALQTGKLMQYIPQKGIYVYFRYDAQKTVMVIYNSNDKDATLDTDRFTERMTGFTGAKDVISGTQLPSVASIGIAPKSTLVLELTK